MVAMREGDWICPGCENHNYASRQQCNKCGGPREDGDPYGAQTQAAGKGRPSPYAIRPTQSPGGGGGGGGGAGHKEGDWNCASCGNHNFASRVNCNKCQEIRPGFKQGDWVCRSCKNHNFASKSSCNRCAAPRPPEAGGGGGGGGGGYMKGGMCGGKGGMYGGGGGCYGGYGGGYMGAPMVPMVYGNPYMGGGKGMVQMMPYGKGKAPYGMMQMPMPMQMSSSKPMKEGDWMCPSCGNHNFASRVKCNKCSVVRQGFKDGDWVCKDCKNHNYASREECNKCKKPRTD